MTTPTHIAVNLAVFVLLIQTKIVDPNYADLTLIICSNLIDLDHLLSKPVYHPKRNPFTTHLIHKKFKFIVAFSLLLIFFRPLMFLGVGLLLHLLLDYIYIRREKLI